MNVCVFGAYDPDYPRNSIIKKGLRSQGVEVSECNLWPRYKFWIRYPRLLSRYRICCVKSSTFFIPEFCQKDVPLAKFISLFTSKKIVFDPLASRFETKISDWKRKPASSWQARWNLKIDQWAFKLSNLVLADTQAHKEYYCQKYGLSSEKIAVLPVGFDDEIFSPMQSLKTAQNSEEFKVLFFGSFLPLHGVEFIVHAAKIVSDEDSAFQFRFVGSGQTLSQSKEMATQLGLKNVHFEGWLPQALLPEKIASADICLGIFGITEKARRVVPHKIFQAMGMGKPVISARTPAVEEFFSHKDSIFLIHDPYPESLARAIIELKKDSVLRKKIATNGCRLVNKNFSTQAVGAKLVSILKANIFSYQRSKFR